MVGRISRKGTMCCNVGSGFRRQPQSGNPKKISENILWKYYLERVSRLITPVQTCQHEKGSLAGYWRMIAAFLARIWQKVSPQRAGNLFGHRVQPAPLTPVITSLLSLRDRLDFNLFKMVQRAIIWALIRLPSTFQSTQAIKFPSGSVLNIANLHFMSDIERNQIFSTLQKIVRFFWRGGLSLASGKWKVFTKTCTI